jgi:hypothetical protein
MPHSCHIAAITSSYIIYGNALSSGFFAQSGEPLKFSFFQFPFGALVFRPLLRKWLVAGLSFAD